MDVSLSTPIARGRTAEIYAWPEHCVLKLYRDWCPAEWVEHESKVARAIVEAGIPTPAVRDVVTVNQRRGIVYERISGMSMLQDMNVHPWTLWKHARNLAQLQRQINALSVPGLWSYREGLKYAIQRAPHLSDPLRERLMERLAGLPDGDRLCHGDFHPDNVLITPTGPIVIDWMTASSGNPWADVARTSMILSVGAKSAGRQVGSIIRTLIDVFHASYLKHYMEERPEGRGELQRWLPVIAAARLDERIEPETPALIELIDQAMRQ